MKLLTPILFAVGFVVAGCSGAQSESAAGGDMMSQTKNMEPPGMDGMAVAASSPMKAKASSRMPAEENGFQLASQRSVIQNRLVIRHADLTLRVDNLEKVEKNVQKLVRGFGGYVDNASSTDLDSDHPTLTVSMRVPSQSFDEAMSQIEALGIRTGKSIKSEDVTEQVVDMDARIKSMLVQEETYRALLKAARRLDDVISLQQQLTDVRGQIESIQGQRKSLASQASLSSISLTLTQSAIAHQAPKDPNWLAQTWGESTTQMGSLLRGVAAFAIWFAVFCPLWVPLLWLAVRAFKAAQPKKQPMNA